MESQVVFESAPARKKRHKRSKSKIVYTIPDEDRILALLPSYESLASVTVPIGDENRARYLHCCMVLIENVLTEIAEYNGTAWSVISSNLSDFVERRRDVMDVTHRRIVWVLRTRIDYTIFSNENKDVSFGEGKELREYMRSRRLVGTRGNILKYSQISFWQTMMLLSERFNYLRFNPLVGHFVDCLYLSCAKLMMWTEQPSETHLLNSHVHSEISKTSGRVRFKEEFADDTERIFAGFHRRLLFAEYFMDNSEVFPKASKEQLQAFFTWMRYMTENNFREIISKDFRRAIFNNHVWADEKDRLKRDDQFGEVSAPRAISKYRGPFIERMSEFNCAKPVKKLLERGEDILVKDEDASKLSDFLGLSLREVDVDFELLVMMCLKCYFLAGFSYPIDAYIWFRWEDDDTLPLKHPSRFTGERFNKMDASDRFPMFVQYFNEFGVLFRDKLYIFPDIASALIHWVKLAETTEDIRGKLPDGKAHTHDLYQRFFNYDDARGNAKDDGIQSLEIEMPAAYTGATKMQVVEF